MRVRIVANPFCENLRYKVEYKASWYGFWTRCGVFTHGVNRDGTTLTALAQATEYAQKIKETQHIVEL
jgi:hypothetical protein